MEDVQIIELYWKREETAISETEKKYGAFCNSIALNILSVPEDAKECVNDTYFQAWNSMPPQRPVKLQAWLGRIVRNIAINLWNKNHRKKRYSGMEQLLNELEDCIPGRETVEGVIEEKELAVFINTWLGNLTQEERVLFVRRYWKGETVKKLAVEFGTSPGKMAKRMYRIRQNLKSALEKEGYVL